jgi:hypothetical protein
VIIYVVWTGEYEDKGIHSMWMDEKKANEMKGILNRGSSDTAYGAAWIEAWELDSPRPEKPGHIVHLLLENGYIAVDYPREICLHEGVPKVFLSTERIGSLQAEVVSSLHYTVYEALQAARDFRMKTLSERQNLKKTKEGESTWA